MTKRLADCTPEEAVKIRASASAYKRNNAEQKAKAAARHKLRYATEPEYRARKDLQANEARLRRRYGAGSSELKVLLMSQGGICPICGTSSPRGGWHTDHNHATGALRAILCGSCNIFLGKIEKDPARLAAAVAYLEVHNAND